MVQGEEVKPSAKKDIPKPISYNETHLVQSPQSEFHLVGMEFRDFLYSRHRNRSERRDGFLNRLENSYVLTFETLDRSRSDLSGCHGAFPLYYFYSSMVRFFRPKGCMM